MNLIEEYARKKRAEYEAVMAGATPPPCPAFAVIGKPERCGAVSTFVSRNITPAGYHSYCCAKHRPRDETEADMRGSDPGWPTTLESVEQARARNAGVLVGDGTGEALPPLPESAYSADAKPLPDGVETCDGSRDA